MTVSIPRADLWGRALIHWPDQWEHRVVMLGEDHLLDEAGGGEYGAHYAVWTSRMLQLYLDRGWMIAGFTKDRATNFLVLLQRPKRGSGDAE